MHITHSFEESKRLADFHLYLSDGSVRVMEKDDLDLIQRNLRQEQDSEVTHENYR